MWWTISLNARKLTAFKDSESTEFQCALSVCTLKSEKWVQKLELSKSLSIKLHHSNIFIREYRTRRYSFKYFILQKNLVHLQIFRIVYRKPSWQPEVSVRISFRLVISLFKYMISLLLIISVNDFTGPTWCLRFFLNKRNSTLLDELLTFEMTAHCLLQCIKKIILIAELKLRCMYVFFVFRTINNLGSI